MLQDDEWLIQGLLRGDHEAARVFCERYGPMLQRIADNHLVDGLRRRVGPETVWQSACRTFLRRAQAGEFQLAGGEDIWRLLCAIMLTKVREKVRFHSRQKRDFDREQPLNPPDSGRGECDELDFPDPRRTEIEAAELEEEFEILLKDLDEEERQLVELKLQQHTNEEAAVLMKRSERTIRRILKRLQAKLRRGLVQE